MINTADTRENEIAIIGMACRFPGAKNVDEFWQNLRDGVESTHFFTDKELLAASVDPGLLRHPNYVKASPVLEGVEWFDAAFFGYSPREAEIMDPQQRLFLECAWEALESAGYDSETYDGRIGVYGGTAEDTYLLFDLMANRDLIQAVGLSQLEIGNSKDYLATRVSYKLNLRGPSVSVQTACSTSLVAVHLACQSLLSGESDLALAGGVSILVPQQAGYLYQEGHIESPDGHCRSFDAHAQGSIFGSGVGIVVLKRLPDALADGDCVHAVVKGSAMNNDGALRVSFTAPGVEGQTQVIAEALALAGVSAETITYVEAHGTATPLGDPIEIAALTRAFRAHSEKRGFCAIGSVKTNFGHLNTAAGVAGLIKTVLALEHKLIPPSLHFQQPNPQIDFDASPFYVNTRLAEWNPIETPRRAGVSSLGMGGTNVHVILEQAPEIKPPGFSRPWQLLVLSAKTPSALEAASDQLAHYLQHHPDQNLADIAYTYQVGRRALGHRRMLVCRDLPDAIQALDVRDPTRILSSVQETTHRPNVFMFPGLGDQYVNMGFGLYQSEPTFREQLDRCAELLQPVLGLDVRTVLYPRGTQVETPKEAPQELDLRKLLRRGEEPTDAASQRLNQTFLAHPTLFVIEYALAQWWRQLGVHPQAMIGHSLGEYVAACLAGVFSLPDALSLVARRAQMIQQLPSGAMLAVLLPEAEVQAWLDEKLSVAAVNEPSLCVLAGAEDAITKVEHRLVEAGVACRRLPTCHAFHSRMMEPIREPFAELVKQVNLHPPQIPFLSNVTGTWITPAEATDPNYWATHLCQKVRFADGVNELFDKSERVFLEIGPGQGLGTLVQQHPRKNAEQIVLSSLRHRHDPQPDEAFLLNTLGRLWLAGARVDWPGLYRHERRRRLPLPTYPFERQRYWIEPQGRYYDAAIPAPAQPEQTVQPAPAVSSSFHPRPGLRNVFVAPRNELERGIAEIYQGLLGIEPIGIHDNYFELGGNSLLIARLLSRLCEVCQVKLPLQVMFAAPTVAGLAQVVEQARRDGLTAVAAPMAVLDLQAEAVLDAKIHPTAQAARPVPGEEPGVGFLTGATGFLGAFVLYELLQQTGTQVYCLVRAANAASAQQRIQKNLERYSLWNSSMDSRILPLAGDLAQPLCGLGAEQFGELTRTVDAIYHSGAWVNWVYPYSALQATNVLGTQEILRLASQVKIKPVHYVSSTAVFDAVPFAQAPVVCENDPPTQSEGFPNGYAQSKWVAEKLVAAAQSRGIPTCVYRSGYVAGHSQTGACNTNDFIFRMAKGCIQLGMVPDAEIGVDIAPVDYVSRALVYLSRQKESPGKVFHLVNPILASWRDIIQWLCSFGYALERVPYRKWRAELEQQCQRAGENALAPLFSYFPEEIAEHTGARRFDCRNTRAALTGTEVACPPVDDKLLSTYFAYLVRSGFLQAPALTPQME